jgi:glucosamine--fructose-6-phosphate aminotransferase (isomerizing)
MCGIVGYVGPNETWPILVKGLKRLEYRGYDSAGMAILGEKGLQLAKCKGRVADLEGIGHTRHTLGHARPNPMM